MIGIKTFIKSKLNIMFIVASMVLALITKQYPDQMYWYTSKIDPYFQEISLAKIFVINYFLILFFYGVFRVVIETGKAFLIKDGE